PENVRTKLEAAQAKKMVRTHKTLQTKREQEAAERQKREQQAAAERAEIERVEQEWKGAAATLSKHFADTSTKAAETYKWLAAEDDPGAAVVDVIRAALNRDGTQLKWDEAAKLADDYLKAEHSKSYEKRKSLFAPAAAAAPAPAAPKSAAPPAAAPAPKPTTTTTPSGNQRWNNDKHRENTRAAFRA